LRSGLLRRKFGRLSFSLLSTSLARSMAFEMVFGRRRSSSFLMWVLRPEMKQLRMASGGRLVMRLLVFSNRDWYSSTVVVWQSLNRIVCGLISEDGPNRCSIAWVREVQKDSC